MSQTSFSDVRNNYVFIFIFWYSFLSVHPHLVVSLPVMLQSSLVMSSCVLDCRILSKVLVCKVYALR